MPLFLSVTISLSIYSCPPTPAALVTEWLHCRPTLEDLVGEIREVVTQKMLELALAGQAVTPPEQRLVEFQKCSGCGQTCPPP